MSERPFAALIRWALVIVALLPLTCFLPACSQTDDPSVWYNRTIVENFGGHTTPSPNAPDHAVAPGAPAVATPDGGVAMATAVPVVAPPTGPVPSSELYWSEISCGALLPAPATSTGFAALTDISLQMTECDVARRAGRPDKVELSAAPDGLRALTLSYLRGPQPRVYHFVAGRLVSIEYPPPLPAPAQKRRPRQARAM